MLDDGPCVLISVSHGICGWRCTTNLRQLASSAFITKITRLLRIDDPSNRPCRVYDLWFLMSVGIMKKWAVDRAAVDKRSSTITCGLSSCGVLARWPLATHCTLISGEVSRESQSIQSVKRRLYNEAFGQPFYAALRNSNKITVSNEKNYLGILRSLTYVLFPTCQHDTFWLKRNFHIKKHRLYRLSSMTGVSRNNLMFCM